MTTLKDVARLPVAEDNAAVAFVELEPGTRIELPDGSSIEVVHRVPVGHRFVVRPVAKDEAVLSWGAPFGRAEDDLVAGSYVCTVTSLAALQERGIPDLPETATVRNETWRRYTKEDGWSVGEQLPMVTDPRTFRGFARPGDRYGTRNYIAVIGLTSREGAFVEEVSRRSQHLVAEAGVDGLDGIVPVAHTEGDAGLTPNNLDLLLRTLVGMIDHTNLGGVVLVEHPTSTVTVEELRTYAQDHGLAWGRVPYEVISRKQSFDKDAVAAVAAVERLVPGARAQQRVDAPMSALAIGLQCGGSDAFSGVSANPLSGAAAREVVRHGGTAVLAETDELIGSEGYILSNVASDEVAEKFMTAVETFADRAGWHGHSAEGNPSGGNILRGLHNIVLKSLGAARKKDPALRLDNVIQYGEPVNPTGFLFMDSPGNDLESVAGQIGSGCNMIYFTTGNGSITNFPFVPTIKFVTTTERFELLQDDMDVNTGRYLDGEDFDELTTEFFDLTIDVASGQQTVGERAGHSQVQIWRDWAQTGPVTSLEAHGLTRSSGAVGLGLPSIGATDPLAALTDQLLPGEPLPVPRAVAAAEPLPPLSRVQRRDGRTASQSVALVLPTSLCSGQVAVSIAERAGKENWHGGRADRTVALPHTEGCGSSSGDSEEIFTRTMINHLRHPNTGWALMLEHGCEKTHNTHFKTLMTEAGVDPSTIGYASIQADGGITAATEKVKQWFDEFVVESKRPDRAVTDWHGVSIGLCGIGADEVATELAEASADLAVRVLASGGSVVLSTEDPLLRSAAFAGLVEPTAAATLGHGQLIEKPGLHLMNGAGSDRLETLTGLGGTGAELIVAVTAGPGQRYTPVLRVAVPGAAGAEDADLVLGTIDSTPVDSTPVGSTPLVDQVTEVLQGERIVTAHRTGDEGFQFTRGLLGVSL